MTYSSDILWEDRTVAVLQCREVGLKLGRDPTQTPTKQRVLEWALPHQERLVYAEWGRMASEEY